MINPTKKIGMAIVSVLALVACGGSTTVSNSSLPAYTLELEDSVQMQSKAEAEGKRQYVGPEGKVLKFGNLEIAVPKGAVKSGTWFEVSFDLPKERRILKFPNYQKNRELYFVAEVPKTKIKVALSIETNAQGVSEAIVLRAANSNENESKKAKLQNVFALGQNSDVATLAATASSNIFPEIPNIVDDQYLGQSSTNKVYYYLVETDPSDYNSRCKAQGGDPEAGYCQFPFPELSSSTSPTTDVSPQSVTSQAAQTPIKVLSWNVGNAALGCLATIAPNLATTYKAKLCYLSTEQTIRNTLSGYMANPATKPDVILFQEIWHGNCAGITDSDTARVCGLASRRASNVHQIKWLIGDNAKANGYRYRCASPRFAGKLVEDGYECIAVSTEKFDFLDNTINTYPGSDARSFYGSTNIFNSVAQPRPCGDSTDTGITSVRAKLIGSTAPISLVSVHLADPTKIGCRATQIEELITRYGRPSSLQLLIGGDFNTDPLFDTTVAGYKFWRTFASSNFEFTPSGVAAIAQARIEGDNSMFGPKVANVIDDFSEITASALSLDHVMSNFLTSPTYCERINQISLGGTDHKSTVCNLQGQFQ